MVWFVHYEASLAAHWRGKGGTREPCEEAVAIILTRNEGDLPRLVALFQLLFVCHELLQNSVA